MLSVVFLGPSLDMQSAKGFSTVEFRPPARQGDILRSVLEGASAIGLVDGLFERVPAVWHKEILFALSRGIPVYGSSSMGAIRAAELHKFGMRGVGTVFQMFVDGTIEDDDEVAIIHAPAELNYTPLSEAMVNVRCTLTAAAESQIISYYIAEAIIRLLL